MAEKNDGILETIKTIFWALLIAGVFRSLFFQPFFIPPGSMKDTLLIGDFVFVNKMAYGYSKWSCPFGMCPIPGRILDRAPERGDIIVFKHPVTKTDYVKRLIGLPGDKIQVQNGVLSINGEVAQQVPAGVFEEVFERQGSFGTVPKCANGAVGEGAICVKDRATETLPGGVSHDVLNVEDYPGMPDNTGVFTVPEGNYFFMGDNRDNSTDSRFPQSAGGVGFVPEELLLGRVDRVMFSAAGKRLVYFWTWRADRFFKKVE